MKHFLPLICVVALALFGLRVQQTQAAGGEIYTVQPGDTLSAIAARYGITVNDLATANGLYWYAWVYTGQQLVIPIQETTPIVQFDKQSSQLPPPVGVIETVQPGDTLSSLAAIYGVSVDQIAVANDLPWKARVYVGRQLVIPAVANIPIYDQPALPPPTQPALSTEPIYTPAAPVAPAPAVVSTSPPTTNGEKWIDINLTTQTVTAYDGETPVFNALTSTGTRQYPTVAGAYKIYVKYEKARMRGGYGVEAYDLPDVPYVMYFYRGYGLHGTYWHNNFGTPMSHGCVNLSTSDAEWLFNWASVGTKVVTHY